jgi:PEP-CTERM motif
LGGLALGSSNGSSWYPLGNYPQQLDYPQYAITAEAIPEPGALGLLALGGLFLVRRRRKASVRIV